MTELIKVTQLPVIEDRLRSMKDYVESKVSEAMSLVCTEDTVQVVKATRAELTKIFSELETTRKSVKAEILAPYERFEAVYQECVSNAFKRADADLKKKIVDVESAMKLRCEDALREYYSELCEAYHIDFVPFERSGVVVSMADAKAKTQPPKKLREQLDQFIADIANSVAMISAMDNSEEIMIEFKNSLNSVAAIATVQERHRRIEAERALRSAQEATKAREGAAIQKVEAFAPPVEKEPEVRCHFTVIATKSQLKQLKDFMNKEGIRYE